MRTVIRHGRAFQIVPLADLHPDRCGVALIGVEGRALWTLEGPCSTFDADHAVRWLDGLRDRLRADLERLESALQQEAPSGAPLPALGPDQPTTRLAWLPRLAAVVLVGVAIVAGPGNLAAATGPVILGLLVLHFLLGFLGKRLHPDPEVDSLGWGAFGWGLFGFILWVVGIEYFTDRLRPWSADWLIALGTVMVAGLSAGHWIRSTWLTRGASPPPPTLLHLDASVGPVTPGPALYDVSWGGRLHPSFGVPTPDGALALLPVSIASRDPDAVPQFAQRVLAHRAALRGAEESRSEIGARVRSVEDALRDLEAG